MNIATIGTSMITERFIDAVNQTPALTLAAAFSRTEERGRAMGAPRVHTDFAALLADESIDVVYVASPNSLHFDQVMQLLAHKKHVICEKPMFSTSREVKEAFDQAERHGVYLFEAFRNLFGPNHDRLKEAVKNIGPVRHSFFQYMKYSSRYDQVLAGEEPNIFSPAFSGGSLVDLGVYPISLAVSLYGEPVRISAQAAKIATGVDGSGTVVLDYGTHVCTIMHSKITDSVLPSEISGEAGLISIDHIAPISSITWTDRKSGVAKELGTEQLDNDMVYEAEAFAKAIQDKDESLYIRGCRISEAVIRITEEARRQCGIQFPADSLS